MATRTAIQYKPFICFKALILFIAVISNIAYGEENEGKQVVGKILLSTVHRGDPPKVDQLKKYSQRAGISLDTIEGWLMSFAGNALNQKNDWEASVRARRSIEILGDLRTTNAVALVRNIAQSSASVRGPALRSVIRIGGTNLLNFAHHVLQDRKTFSDLDRYALYEELSPYVGVDAVRPKEIEAGESRENEGRANDVRSFLENAILDESDGGNIVRLDKILCLADKNYPRSFLRERALSAVEQSKVAKHKNYATGELKRLRDLPKSKRTRVDAVEGETRRK